MSSHRRLKQREAKPMDDGTGIELVPMSSHPRLEPGEAQRMGDETGVEPVPMSLDTLDDWRVHGPSLSPHSPVIQVDRPPPMAPEEASTRITRDYWNAYQKARKRPGSAEFLATLLTGPNHSCPHQLKIASGVGTKIPFHLDFFHDVKPTNKLCADCYNKAVPRGYNSWSLSYSGFRIDVGLPPHVEAGQEGFEKGGVVSSDKLIMGNDLRHRSALVVDSYGVGKFWGFRMPNGAGVDLYKFLEHIGDPFYIDLIHRVLPFNPKSSDRTQQLDDLTEENLAAYFGAKWIVVEEEGGAGISTTLEQRVVVGRILEWRDTRNVPRGEILPQRPAYVLPQDHTYVRDWELRGNRVYQRRRIRFFIAMEISWLITVGLAVADTVLLRPIRSNLIHTAAGRYLTVTWTLIGQIIISSRLRVAHCAEQATATMTIASCLAMIMLSVGAAVGIALTVLITYWDAFQHCVRGNFNDPFNNNEAYSYDYNEAYAPFSLSGSSFCIFEIIVIVVIAFLGLYVIATSGLLISTVIRLYRVRKPSKRRRDVIDHLPGEALPRYQELLTRCEEWSLPPGYPHFFDEVTLAVNEMQQRTTRAYGGIGLHRIDEPTPREQERRAEIERTLQRWRDPNWEANRAQAARNLNQFLEVYGVPQSQWVNERDPMGLKDKMGPETDLWLDWQKYKFKNKYRDHELYEGYRGVAGQAEIAEIERKRKQKSEEFWARHEKKTRRQQDITTWTRGPRLDKITGKISGTIMKEQMRSLATRREDGAYVMDPTTGTAQSRFVRANIEAQLEWRGEEHLAGPLGMSQRLYHQYPPLEDYSADSNVVDQPTGRDDIIGLLDQTDRPPCPSQPNRPPQ